MGIDGRCGGEAVRASQGRCGGIGKVPLWEAWPLQSCHPPFATMRDARVIEHIARDVDAPLGNVSIAASKLFYTRAGWPEMRPG